MPSLCESTLLSWFVEPEPTELSSTTAMAGDIASESNVGAGNSQAGSTPSSLSSLGGFHTPPHINASKSIAGQMGLSMFMDISTTPHGHDGQLE